MLISQTFGCVLVIVTNSLIFICRYMIANMSFKAEDAIQGRVDYINNPLMLTAPWQFW